jgi:hypothetical protein
MVFQLIDATHHHGLSQPKELAGIRLQYADDLLDFQGLG